MKKLTKAEAKIILTSKGYKESSFDEFYKNERYIQNVQQSYVCEHNLDRVLKPNSNLFYLL